MEEMLDLNHYIFNETLLKLPSSIQYSARALFDILDSSLDPQISIIAIPFDAQSETLVARTEKIECEPAWFKKIKSTVTGIPEYYFDSLAPDIQGVLWQERVKIKQAVQRIIDKKSNTSGYRGFTIFPDFQKNHSMSIVLYLSKEALLSHYSLKRNSIRPFPVETSLIYEVIDCFLRECASPVRNPHLRDNGEELLRQAGYWLMETPGKVTGHRSSESLFHTLNIISSMRYEGAEGSGKIIISPRNHPSIDVAVTLRNPVSLANYRGVRKLLEITSSEIQLLCDSNKIYGMGFADMQSYDESKENLFHIEFTGHHIWKLCHAKNELMIVKYGKPRLIEKPISTDLFFESAKTIFSNINSSDLECLWSIVDKASKQKHGTMIVISDRAKEEAERLRNQSTPIQAKILPPDLTLPLSSIDGALLLDTKAICHAVGVILDGIATERGNPARGARYNSAIRYSEYVKTQKHACLIVVISEDGMIDLI
ncbi:MAG: DNA integrity scanning protein DisA nucleotide-binding domain protein [Anaerolineales bacterium]|nr:DNA integrity scanning protein DisA nucleotide-binding domain protein [Anaerolineales bacterium]